MKLAMCERSLVVRMKEYAEAGQFVFSGVFPLLEQGMALVILEGYVNGAILQRHRIKEEKALFYEIVSGKHAWEKTEPRNKYWLDVHFYFICCDKVRSVFSYLATTDSEIWKLWNTLWPTFQEFRDARNELEHLDEKFNREYLRGTGYAKDEKYAMGGRLFDYSDSSLKIVTDSYEALISLLRMRKTHPPA